MNTVAATYNKLGEGPLWDNTGLRWVDIEAHRVYRIQAGQVTFTEFQTPVTSLGQRTDGGFIVSTGRGFALWDSNTPHLDFLANPYPTGRFNDGMVSPAGNFWAGTMSDGETAILFRYAANGEVTALVHGLTISNGLGWSPDHTTFYLTDTRRDLIYAYDYDPATDTIHHRRKWVDTADVPGKPDGLAVASDGSVWSCMWGGACIRRYDPRGKLLDEITMPVACPTSCTFGGEGLSTLFITTANIADPDNPQAGNLFSIETEVSGQPETRYAYG